jgi:hypothetical protein
MLGFLMPIINTLFGGLLLPLFKEWTAYRTNLATSKEAGFEAAAKVDQANLQTIANAEIANNALKVQLYGTPTYRIITLVVGLPVAVHFGLIFVDTILASKFLYGSSVLGVPDPPGQYPLYEWAIIASFFLVHAVNIGTSNVKQWMAK